MEELREQVLNYIENETKHSYYYKGILWETFWEYEFRYKNCEDYKENLSKELLTLEDLKEITDYICDDTHINMTLRNIMYDRFETYKKGD